jgi:hypothetical protein
MTRAPDTGPLEFLTGSANGLRYHAALPLRFVFLYRDSGFTLLRQRSDEQRSHLV